MGPTQRGRDRSSNARGIVKRVIAAIGVGLQDTGEALKMPHGMFMPPVAGGVINRRRRFVAAKGPVIPDIGPNMPLDRLAFRQDRHRGVVAVQPLRRQDMGLDQGVERQQNHSAGADLIGQRRDAEIDALSGIALALAIQRLVLAELLEQDHGQQVRPGKAARRHMEGRGRLRDRLATPARELLTHCLDHLPPPRDDLERLGDVLTQPGQLRRPAAGTALWRRDHHALAGQMIGKRLARRPPALEGFDRLCPPRRFFGCQFVLGRCRLQIFELKLHLVQQPRRPLRTRPVELTPQFLDRQLEMGDQGLAAGKIRLRIGRFGLGDRSIGLSREARMALRDDHRMRGGEVGRKRFQQRLS